MRKLFGDFLRNVWSALSNVFFSISLIDMLDIALLTCLIYAILKFVRETRAGQLLKGILILVGVYLISGVMKLRVIQIISGKALSVGLIAIIVLFPSMSSEVTRIVPDSTNPNLLRLSPAWCRNSPF